MSQLSPYLRMTENGPAHWCPGCQEMHVFYTRRSAGTGANWRWDGRVDKPTFMPSMIVSHGAVVDDDGTVALPEERCHYFLANGMIQFLGDCTHNLAGQTVPLPELP
jgi:hypothetical protein